MKALWIFALSAVPVLAQPPAPQTPPLLELRPLELNFKDVKLSTNRPAPFRIAMAAAPKVCAIPLSQAKPKGNFPMKIMKAPDVDPAIQAKHGIPACDDVMSGRP